MTTQGFLTYYYEEVANAAKVEMNRCSFSNTAEEYNSDNSVLLTVGGKVDCVDCAVSGGHGDGDGDGGQCRDCCKSKFEDVSVADLSYCRAPWECGVGVGVGDDGDSGETDDKETSSASDNLLSSGLWRQYQRYWFSGRVSVRCLTPSHRGTAVNSGRGESCEARSVLLWARRQGGSGGSQATAPLTRAAAAAADLGPL